MKVNVRMILLLAALALLGGCCSTSMSSKVEKTGPMMVTKENFKLLSDSFLVMTPTVRKVNGLLDVQTRGQNSSKHDQDFEYRYIWMDAQGHAIPSVSNVWKPLPLRARDSAWMQGMAPSPKATDFQIAVRFAYKGTTWWCD